MAAHHASGDVVRDARRAVVRGQARASFGATPAPERALDPPGLATFRCGALCADPVMAAGARAEGARTQRLRSKAMPSPRALVNASLRLQ